MEIRTLQERTRSVVVEVGPEPDDTVKLVYRPGVLTPVELDAVDSAPAGERLAAELLAKCLVSWDLTDGGKMYPLTAAAIEQLDLQFLNLVQTEVINDARPKSRR
jgi:hypothetical protein